MKLEPDYLIDNIFRVNKFLGKGASGEVYSISLDQDWKAYKAGTQFALKFYSDEILEREKADIVYARRIREATNGSQLNCENVVKTFDTSEFWLDGDKPQYLLMELIQGEQLDDWVKKNSPIPIDKFYDITLQVAEGLNSLHKQGIIHRDVKPANIVLTNDGRAVLLDLGVIRPLYEATMTGTESFLGTLRYAAPEWLLDLKFSPASDVYSLGTVIFLLLTGKDVFSDINLFTRLVRAIEQTNSEAPVVDENPQRAYLAQLANKMLSKNPAERPSLESVIVFLKSFDASSEWIQFRKKIISQMFPNLRYTPHENEIIEILTANVNLKQLDVILSKFDKPALDELLEIDKTQSEISLFRTNSAQYLSLSDNERINWVKRAFTVLDAVNGYDDGGNIEMKCYFAEEIRGIEYSPEVLSSISPLLDNAEAAMTEMIQVWAQENPSD